MKSLYEIGADLLALDLHLEALVHQPEGEEPDPEVLQAIESYRAELATEQGEKLDRVYGYLAMLEMEMKRCRDESALWQLRAQTREEKINRIKAMVMAHLQACGGSAKSASGIPFRVQVNGGKPPVILEDGFACPSEFEIAIVVRKPDKELIRKALEAGEAVPGALLGERGHHLRVV